jgi:chemotaxis family two-component system response regulator Rcp1
VNREKAGKPIEILMIEDNLGYALLVKEAFMDAQMPITMSIVRDGVEALAFLYKKGEHIDAPRPDLILLDLNLPRKNGHEVLAEMNADPDLKSLPVVVLTNSTAEKDILKAYKFHVKHYIAKPDDLEQFSNFIKLVRSALREKEENPM